MIEPLHRDPNTPQPERTYTDKVTGGTRYIPGDPRFRNDPPGTPLHTRTKQPRRKVQKYRFARSRETFVLGLSFNRTYDLRFHVEYTTYRCLVWKFIIALPTEENK